MVKCVQGNAAGFGDIAEEEGRGGQDRRVPRGENFI